MDLEYYLSQLELAIQQEESLVLPHYDCLDLYDKIKQLQDDLESYERNYGI